MAHKVKALKFKISKIKILKKFLTRRVLFQRAQLFIWHENVNKAKDLGSFRVVATIHYVAHGTTRETTGGK